MGSIPGLERFPGEGNGNPLQYSCLENPMDGGTCNCDVCQKNQIYFLALESRTVCEKISEFSSTNAQVYYVKTFQVPV